MLLLYMVWTTRFSTDEIEVIKQYTDVVIF